MNNLAREQLSTARQEIMRFESNNQAMDWFERNTSFIAPNRDHDQRYKDLYETLNQEDLKVYLKYIDWSNTEQFLNSGEPLKFLQPRATSLSEREPEIQATMGTLYDDHGNLTLDRTPILAELLDDHGKLGKITGWKRGECLRRKKEFCWTIVVEGATNSQIARLSRIGNKQTKSDIEPQSEEDYVTQYTTAAELWMEERGIESISVDSEEEESLKKFLTKSVCEEQYKYNTDSRRLGVVINLILDNVRAQDDKRYWKQQEISFTKEDTVEVDKFINKELQKFVPHSIWDPSLNTEKQRGVYQLFSSAETSANTKQKLDTLLESNDRVYSGEQSLHLVEWIKFKKGKGLGKTVEKELDTRLKFWTNINNNERRVRDYNIKPIERLFFPPSFVEMEGRLFDWDRETRSFIEKFPV